MFGDTLKTLRKSKKLTQNELGKILGISGRVIGFYETDNRFPKEEKVLVDIANFFNVSVDYLLNNDYNPNDKIEASQQIYELFRDKGLIVEGKKLSDEFLESLSKLLDNTIDNAEQIHKIFNSDNDQ